MEQLLLKYMKINKRVIHYSLFIILILAAFLRIYKLSTIPPHLTPDEAALGYNAYSILKTGRDEYGKFMPMIFKSFGDYKPGLYVYLTTPFVAIFGLNEFAVRLPSALAGVMAVWLIYKIVSYLFPDKNFSLFTFHFSLGEISALLLTISPWHLHFSRGAWEVNVSLTLTLAGIYFFLRALDTNRLFGSSRAEPESLRMTSKGMNIIWSSICFSLTLVTYQGAKLSTLLVLMVLAIVFRKEVLELIKGSKKYIIAAFILGLVISSPALLSFFREETGRLEIYSVFSYPRKTEDVNRLLIQGNEEVGGLSYKLYHSEPLNFARVIFGKWFNHFSGRFLFFEGDWPNPRHSVPNHGMLLLVDILLLIVGLVVLIKLKGKAKWFILLWLVLAPLPAILSRDQVHSVRAYNMVIPLTFVSSLGLMILIKFIKRVPGTIIRNSYFTILVLAFIGSLVYYFDSYYVHLSKHTSRFWSYGNKQIVETVTPIQGNYDKVKVQQSFAQPYIYFLFYQKYDPVEYQKQAKLTESQYKGDVGYVERLDNIYFWPINWPADRQDHGTLVVADPIRIPEEDFSKETNLRLLKEIRYLDGNLAFKVVEVN